MRIKKSIFTTTAIVVTFGLILGMTTTTIPFSQTASAETVLGTSGDDKIKTGEGDDFVGGQGGDDKIKTGEGDDFVGGGPGADKFKCGSGEDTVFFFNEAEGDKATGNCKTFFG